MLVGSALVARSQITVFCRKVKARFITTEAPPPYASRKVVDLPAGGDTVSVECAFNSRCSSDDDGHQDIFHWGQLDVAGRVPPQHISRVAKLAAECVPADAGTSIQNNDDVLTFLVDSKGTEPLRRTRMIHSGMQQQAVGLACAALGIGITFQAQGPDGHELPSDKVEAVKIKLASMKASYGPRFWTSSAPTAELPWMKGNLPDPKRDGTRPLLDVLTRTKLERNGRDVALEDLGQLLWAARGRTPHLYKSRPWGLTVPTWQGLQDISSVSIATNSNFFDYVNWKNGRPTHSVESTGTAAAACRWLANSFAPWNCFMLLCAREPYARALWETGYGLLNVVLQADTLGLAYRAIMLAEPDQNALRDALAGSGRPDKDRVVPSVVIALKSADDHLLAELLCIPA